MKTIYLVFSSDYDCCYHARAFASRDEALAYARSHEAREKWGDVEELEIDPIDYDDGNEP